MYCRRRAREGAFGSFVYAEGEYLHDVDASCNLREVMKHRLAGKAGQEWLAVLKRYRESGVKTGPMHYPTHSTSGPVSVMGAHAERVCAWGYANRTGDPYFGDSAYSNETALFYMSNGATMRICEYREIGHPEREIFRVYGTQGSFENDTWLDNLTSTPLTVQEMRDPLPEDVARAFRSCSESSDFYGGHGGSHAYLVHEFVDAIAHDRTPAIHVWEAVRYMAAGVMAHKSAMRDGEILEVPDWGDAPA
jgi:predicted dehydrogenase